MRHIFFLYLGQNIGPCLAQIRRGIPLDFKIVHALLHALLKTTKKSGISLNFSNSKILFLTYRRCRKLNCIRLPGRITSKSLYKSEWALWYAKYHLKQHSLVIHRVKLLLWSLEEIQTLVANNWAFVEETARQNNHEGKSVGLMSRQ